MHNLPPNQPVSARRLTALLIFALGAFAVPGPSHAQTPQTVPSSWSLIPAGLTSGDSFRLLFVTHGRTAANSPYTADYNLVVRTEITNFATGSGVPIVDFKDEFRAVISSTAIDARDNIAATGEGVPIYWLNGDKIADNYAGFYDGTWDSTVGRNQRGDIVIPARDVWTGSNNDGTENIEDGTSRAVGAGTIRTGSYETAGNVLQGTSTSGRFSRFSLYALSPLITVVAVPPTFDTSTISDQSYPAGRAIETLTLPPAIGGTGTLSYALTPIPTGLTFNAANRTLSGMPTTTDTTALTYTVTDSATNPNTVALTFSVTVAMLSLSGPPVAQTVSENYTFAPTSVPADRKFRLLFVTTQTTDATSADIDTYNAFVQTSAAVGHRDIRGFNSEFRALISTDTVDARVNTATNSVPPGSDAEAPIYWLGGDKVADDYADFYDDDGWDSPDGRDRNGGTYAFTNTRSSFIWTGSQSDGTKDDTHSAGNTNIPQRTRYGQLTATTEIDLARFTVAMQLPLYALSPILTLNQAPTISTVIPDQTAPVGTDFTYAFLDTTFADAGGGDALTYSASESPDAAWLNFDSASRTFSGTPTAADVGFVTITVTASDGIDEVTTEFSVAVVMLSLSGPPEPQTVSANYTFAPSPVPDDRKFRLLFVTTQTTDATSADIATYNAFVQTSAAVGHSDIRGFNSEFRALISTDTVDARVNTATNSDTSSDPPGTDTNAPIYWLGSDDQVATGYGDFYDGNWLSVAGRDQNGDTTTPSNIWTGSNSDGTKHDPDSAGNANNPQRSRVGQLTATGEINDSRGPSVASLALYALSPILILNQVPTLTTLIPTKTLPSVPPSPTPSRPTPSPMPAAAAAP